MAANPSVAFHIVLSVLIIFANITVSLALRFMKTVKRTTIIFLADLAISNLVQGTVSLSKAVLYIWHVHTFSGCIFTTVIFVTTTGTYMTGVFFVYLDLYLSLKKKAIGKAVISTRLAAILVALTWFVWIATGTAAYGMRNKDFVYEDAVGCLITSGLVTKEYIILVEIIIMISITVIMVLHVLTYKLLKKAKRGGESLQEAEDVSGRGVYTVSISTRCVVSNNKARNERIKWVMRKDAILKTMLAVLIMFIVCWYPIVFVSLVIVVCKPCSSYIKKEVLYVMYLLVVVQYNSNGIIYLIKIKEFRKVLKKLCCRCCSRRQVADIDSEASLQTSLQE